MNDTFDYITRFVIIVFGYCCSVLVAGWFLAAILFRTLGVDSFMNDFVMMASDIDTGSLWAATSFWSAVFVGGFVLAAMAGGFSFVPALILIILAEARGYKSSLFYCVAGALIGLAARIASVQRWSERARKFALDRSHCRRRCRRQLRLLAVGRAQCRTAFNPPG
ncbi:hypothetical protein HGG72_00525 [Ochrobactrum pecoris]|nr:hypothetical protein [Brucella pecoris]